MGAYSSPYYSSPYYSGKYYSFEGVTLTASDVDYLIKVARRAKIPIVLSRHRELIVARRARKEGQIKMLKRIAKMLSGQRLAEVKHKDRQGEIVASRRIMKSQQGS